MNKKLLKQAFEAGRTWQIAETAEYNGGKENEKPNFEEWYEEEDKKLNIPHICNRSWIVTIECGDTTVDWKITAPNELAAKITASLNYSGKQQHKILRCFEYGR
jgi:hypothetical protein